MLVKWTNMSTYYVPNNVLCEMLLMSYLPTGKTEHFAQFLYCSWCPRTDMPFWLLSFLALGFLSALHTQKETKYLKAIVGASWGSQDWGMRMILRIWGLPLERIIFCLYAWETAYDHLPCVSKWIGSSVKAKILALVSLSQFSMILLSVTRDVCGKLDSKKNGG